MSTILIADDHPSFRRQARALLVAAGHDVIGEAADGRSALEAADALAPEVVLLDIGLPDMDGFEVADRLALSRTAPAVILTSSRDAASYGPRLTGSQARGFIAKDDLSGDALAAALGTGR